MQKQDETDAPLTFQAQFHRRWNHLGDPHVRTLAWLLDAPDLLDPAATQWQGKIARLDPIDESTSAWLANLDHEPEALHAYLALQPATRLGRYAEKLMAFYLEQRGVLFAHGVQVRASRNDTIGEFDFLLKQGESLLHWEFATKLYLLESGGHGHQTDYFVGPNLADTLGAKVRKIMDRQLSLSQHPAARVHLPLPVAAAQALVKGWLFYQGQTPLPAHPHGVSRAHCRGFWCAANEVDELAAEHYLILPRLSWLAPARVKAGDDQVLARSGLAERLRDNFAETSTPVLVALMRQAGDWMLESDRGFIVSEDWRARAEARVRSMAGAVASAD